jgi:hypothetical protein
VMRGNESYGTSVRFIHSSEEKGDGWRRSGVGVSGGSRALSREGRRRRVLGGPWAGVAGWAECHLGQHEEKTKKRMEWAARMTGPKWKIGFGFDFPILFQGFELKIKGFKYFQIKFELRSN